MDYVLLEWDHDLDDEPYLVYSELDEKRQVYRVSSRTAKAIHTHTHTHTHTKCCLEYLPPQIHL